MSIEQSEDQAFERLLEYLKQKRGFDFTGYKRNSLRRRIVQRMQHVNIESFDSYLDFLEVDPNEFTHLFNTILINVTDFLRDASAWDYVHNFILPKIIEGKSADEPIRVWSAGTASGEEAYSIAMLLAEHLGFDAFKRRVKIYATDMDEEALLKARSACYTAREVEGVPENLREKYFDQTGERYFFHKELRRTIIFGRHNLIQDAPISRVDLILCRNILMYFNAETQARVLTRLHFALNAQGFIFLGKAEMLLTHTNLFSPADLKHRVFSKVERENIKDRILPRTIQRQEMDNDDIVYMIPKIREAASESNPVAQIAIDMNGTLVLANERARTLFGLSISDVGRPIQDLKLSYQPVDLRSLIDQAKDNIEPRVLKEVPWVEGEVNDRFYDISVVALNVDQNKPVGVSLSFFDVSPQKRLQRQLEHTNQELETAMEELESTNEELETTNEELQSTIEELETTNEELQAANEELETMNEELQATNEELETLNSEMSMRTGEINQVNAYLNSILASLSTSVVVVNRDYLVEIWNPKSEDMWGLRKNEVLGQSFFSLDIGLPVEKLKRPIRGRLNGEDGFEVFEIGATNRRGQSIQLRCSTSPLYNRQEEVAGVILILEQDEQQTVEKLGG
jgi:two-component system, chemotaxis family, CheB/CheR fusion protein